MNRTSLKMNIIGLLCSLAFVFSASAAAIPDDSNSTAKANTKQVKMISYILDMFEWSDDVANQETFTYCTLSSNTNNVNLDKVRFHRKPVKVISLTDMNDADEKCNTVHIVDDQQGDFEKILSHFQNKPILLISDEAEFARMGGHVSLFKLNNRLAFTMNIPSLEDSGFSVDLSRFSKLIVEPLPNELN